MKTKQLIRIGEIVNGQFSSNYTEFRVIKNGIVTFRNKKYKIIDNNFNLAVEI